MLISSREMDILEKDRIVRVGVPRLGADGRRNRRGGGGAEQRC